MSKIIKRIAGMALALAFCVTFLQVPASAAAEKPITGFSGEQDLLDTYYLDNNEDPNDLTIYPGKEIRIPLTANMFNWEDDRTLLPNEAVRARELRWSRTNVRTRVRSGSEVLDYVQINTDRFDSDYFFDPGSTKKTDKTAYISIMFTEKLVSEKDVDFEMLLVLSVNNEIDENFEMRIAGTMKNEVIEVTEDMDYVKIADNFVAEGKDHVQKVRMDIGAGVTVHKVVLKGQRYYGFTAIVDDMSIIRESYPDIFPMVRGVYRLETRNLRYGNYGVSIVPQLDPDTPQITFYHVYNEDLVYLGTTNDRLYYSDVYILTAEKLENMEEDIYEDELVEAPNQEKL